MLLYGEFDIMVSEITVRQWLSNIAALRAKEPNVRRWCPSHQGIEGNGIADEWAKLAAGEPDVHGIE